MAVLSTAVALAAGPRSGPGDALGAKTGGAPKAATKSATYQHLAEKTNLYLDVTGLGCYHKKDVPAWYDRLSEKDRWEVQARFWEAVAARCPSGSA